MRGFRSSMRFTQSHSGHRGNPLYFPIFRVFQQNVLRRILLRVAILLVPIGAATLYWIFFSDFFQITEIKVQSSLSLQPELMRETVLKRLNSRRWRIVPESNILLFDINALSAAFVQNYALSEITVEKNLSQRAVFINISEKPRQALWATRGRLYALDSEGSILGETAPDRQNEKHLIIYDAAGAEVSKDEQVLTPATLKFIMTLYRDDEFGRLEPSVFALNAENGDMLTITVSEGWRIRFDPSASLDDQLRNLRLTLTHSIAPDDRKRLDYMDLRFGERIYFKYK